MLAGCGDGDSSGNTSETVATTDIGDGNDASGGDDDSGGGDAAVLPAGGTVVFGGEEISMQPLRCFFQEQPRAGLGGIFTHTAQAQGTNAAGEPVLLDTTRAIAEDGTVEFDLSFGVGEFGPDYKEFFGTGQEVTFGDNSVSATAEVDDFVSGPMTLTFDLSCS